jgi:hypothetical protein
MTSGWPARYEVRVERVLGARWSDWFGGLEVESDADETILSGTLSDRSEPGTRSSTWGRGP